MTLLTKTPITFLRCVVCAKEYGTKPLRYTCDCSTSSGMLEVVYDYETMSRSIKKSDFTNSKLSGMWRYAPLLPVPNDMYLPEICVGNTPLSANRGFAQKMDLRSVMIKDDSRLPSGSLKDRASAMAVVKAKELGFDTISTASTGNAAAALACLCANFGLRAIVYVPASTPIQKLIAIKAYGAKVISVDGTYDDAFEQCMRDSQENDWYIRNTGYNPYMTEGKKTVSYEICEQLDWSVPDAIFISVGDGSIIGGVYKGFYDLMQLGWTHSMPKLFGVQAEGSNYIADAWQKGANPANLPSRPAHTFADSLHAELPKDRVKAINAVTKTLGAYIQVSDDEILKSMLDYSNAGYLAEPAAAAALAGLFKASANGLLESHESVVVINTGTGLKDIESIRRMLELRSVE